MRVWITSRVWGSRFESQWKIFFKWIAMHSKVFECQVEYDGNVWCKEAYLDWHMLVSLNTIHCRPAHSKVMRSICSNKEGKIPQNLCLSGLACLNSHGTVASYSLASLTCSHSWPRLCQGAVGCLLPGCLTDESVIQPGPQTSLFARCHRLILIFLSYVRCCENKWMQKKQSATFSRNRVVLEKAGISPWNVK